MVITSRCDEVIMDDDLVFLFEVAWESRFGYWPRSTSRHIAHCSAAGGRAQQRGFATPTESLPEAVKHRGPPPPPPPRPRPKQAAEHCSRSIAKSNQAAWPAYPLCIDTAVLDAYAAQDV